MAALSVSVPVFRSRIWKGASLELSTSSPRRGENEDSTVPSAQWRAGEGLRAGFFLECGLNVPDCSTQSKHTAKWLPPALALFPLYTFPLSSHSVSLEHVPLLPPCLFSLFLFSQFSNEVTFINLLPYIWPTMSRISQLNLALWALGESKTNPFDGLNPGE